MDNGNNNLKIHFGYIIGILLLVIISLIVSKFGDNTNLVNYISFAVGLTSIFLAVISIIYAFYSNFSQSNILGKIDVTSERLNAASEDITQSAKNLSSELQVLKDTIKDIPDGINKMSSKIDFANSILSNNNLSGNSEEIHKNDNISENSVKIQEDLKILYKEYSTIGLIGLYIAYLCYTNKKEFDFEKVGIVDFNPNEYVGIRNFYYLYGCFITLASCYLLRIEPIPDNTFVFKVVFLSPYIDIKEIKKILEERPDTGQKKLIKQIDEYFNQ